MVKKQCHFQYRFSWCLTPANHAVLEMEDMKLLVSYNTMIDCTYLKWTEFTCHTKIIYFVIYLVFLLIKTAGSNCCQYTNLLLKSRNLNTVFLIIILSPMWVFLYWIYAYVSTLISFLENEVNFFVKSFRDLKLEKILP